MPAKDKDRKPGGREEPVSLDPVPFEEAVADLLKVKKPEKPKRSSSNKTKGRN